MTARALRQGLPGLIALLLGIAIFEFIQPVVIASFGGAAGLNAIMERIPPALQAFARTRPEFLALSGLAGYLSLGFTHPLYLVLAGAAVVGFSARSLAGEMDRGSIQLPLSRPISRGAVYGSRVAGVILICLLLCLAGPLGMIAGLSYAQPGTMEIAHFFAVAVAGLALFWSIGGLSLLFSATASSSGRVIGWAIGVLVISYFIDYFAGVWKPLQRWTVLSLFNYYEPSKALVSGEINIADIATLALVGLVTMIAGLVVFVRRDFPS
ncbi:MAG: ABC transporter permease subunit [Thermomicrobiales bacterium]